MESGLFALISTGFHNLYGGINHFVSLLGSSGVQVEAKSLQLNRGICNPVKINTHNSKKNAEEQDSLGCFPPDSHQLQTPGKSGITSKATVLFPERSVLRGLETQG